MRRACLMMVVGLALWSAPAKAQWGIPALGWGGFPGWGTAWNAPGPWGWGGPRPIVYYSVGNGYSLANPNGLPWSPYRGERFDTEPLVSSSGAYARYSRVSPRDFYSGGDRGQPQAGYVSRTVNPSPYRGEPMTERTRERSLELAGSRSTTKNSNQPSKTADLPAAAADRPSAPPSRMR